MEKIKKFLIKGIEVNGYGSCDIDVGVCETKQTAERICEKLKSENNKYVKQYNNFCRRCECNCDSFPTKEKADLKLDEIRRNMSECPYVGEITSKELFVKNCKTNKDESIGFEVCCDRYRYTEEYEYYIVEIDLLKDCK